MNKSFLFIGGDLRSLYAAGKLSQNFDVDTYGFNDKNLVIPSIRILSNSPEEKYDYVILPLPASTDNKNINAPYFSKTIPLNIIPYIVKSGGLLFTGKSCTMLEEICDVNNITLVDYFEREELVVMNAVPTAEGAIEIIMKESGSTIYGMNILVTGYGRIAKVLVKYLTALGANVTVCARKYSDLAWAEIMGCGSVHISSLDSRLKEFETIINTVPARLFGKEQLSRLKPDCLIVDVASKTGLEDFEQAKNAGVNVIWALSLPGKVAPITAGHIIADTILNIVSERTALKTSGEKREAE